LPRRPGDRADAGKARERPASSPAPSVWSRTGSAGPRVRAGGYWQAGNLRSGRRTSGMPSMRTRRYGTSRALRGCLPKWFAASSPSPGTGGKATTAQTSRPGGALDCRPPGPVALPALQASWRHRDVVRPQAVLPPWHLARSSGIERVDGVGVLGVDDAALELERGGEFAGLRCPFRGQQVPPLHLLHAGQPLVGGGYPGRHLG